MTHEEAVEKAFEIFNSETLTEEEALAELEKLPPEAVKEARDMIIPIATQEPEEG